MKTKIFLLDKSASSRFQEIFHKPIRDKMLVLKILLDSVEYISFDLITNKVLNDKTHMTEDNIKFILSVNKHSRILFCSPKKIFSIIFPFHYNEQESNFHFNGVIINFAIISYIREILTIISNNENKLFSDKIIEFYLDNPEADPDRDNAVNILSDLILLEDGYIRYDDDPEHANGNLHPLYHYDIFYHAKNTFKIGLKSGIGHNEFIELLDCSKERCFLNKP
ncbi:hypothetical protein [Neisseria animaloris]|uniref:hypothetical protein n=1 Tax=Neisseria animaloris TaxID=326522 RepID=UPI000D30D27D|nr:hypothetical protein [Neisseria animaloris]